MSSWRVISCRVKITGGKASSQNRLNQAANSRQPPAPMKSGSTGTPISMAGRVQPRNTVSLRMQTSAISR